MTLTQRLLKSDLTASLVAFGCIMLAFVGLPGEVVAAVLVAFITMKKGWRSGAMVVAFVALPAVGYALHKEFSPFDIVFFQAVLIYLFAGLLGQFYSWRLVLQVMLLLGVVAIAIFHLVMADPSAYWMTLVTKMLKQVQATVGESTDLSAITQQIQHVSSYLTGLIALSMTAVIFGELVLARIWCFRSANQPGRFKAEFLNIRLGYLEAVLLTAVLVGVACHLPIAKDILFATVLPFVICGLSYLHSLQQRIQPLLVLLVFIYVSLFVSVTSMYSLMMLATIGYVDSILNLRNRFAIN